MRPFLCAIWNSFVPGRMICLKSCTAFHFFLVHRLPASSLFVGRATIDQIASRAARHFCTAPKLNSLDRGIALKRNPPTRSRRTYSAVRSIKHRATSHIERAQLRAYLCGLVIHLNCLSGAESAQVLGSFSWAARPVKVAAQNARCLTEQGLIKWR